MDYIISENRLLRLIDSYLEENYGTLHEVPVEQSDYREGDFDLLTDQGDLVMRFMDHNLGLYTQLYYTLMSLFNLSGEEIEHIFELWFKKNYPDKLLLTVYCSIY